MARSSSHCRRSGYPTRFGSMYDGGPSGSGSMDSSSRSRSLASSSRSRSRHPTGLGSMYDDGPSGSRSRYTDKEMTISVSEEHEVLVTVTSSTKTVEGFLREVRGEEPKPLIVGLDTEHAEYEGKKKIALIQICVNTRCLLFQVGVAGGCIPDDLKSFFVRENHVFVGVAIANDMDLLRQHHNIELSKKVELQAMVPFVIQGKWCNVPSLASIGLELLGVVAEKNNPKLRYKDWHKKSLADEQIKYACTDAFVSYKVGEMLQSQPYNFDLHACQSPVHAGGGQQVQLLFVEHQQTKRINACPACPPGTHQELI